MSLISVSQASVPLVNEKLLQWMHKHMPEFRPTSTAEGLELLSQLVHSDNESLRSLIDSSSGLVEPGKARPSEFMLGLRHGGTKSETPKREGERRMCHEIWKQKLSFALGDRQSIARIHSYEVPLVPDRTSTASDGSMIKTREIDLLASSKSGHPIVIEVKRASKKATKGPSEEATALLLGMFMQGLSYAVTLRYTWDQQSSELLGEWKKTLAELGLVDRSVLEKLTVLGKSEIPVILAADGGYWARNFKWGDEGRKYWGDLAVLARLAREFGYPIYAGRFTEATSKKGTGNKWKLDVCAFLDLPTPKEDNHIRFPRQSPDES